MKKNAATKGSQRTKTVPNTTKAVPSSSLHERLRSFFTEKNVWILFCLISIIGLYLRFYSIDTTQVFGWDQGRDAFVAKDILEGKFPLLGPRTGVGHMHLGPLYYYLLAPFYAATNLDPMAANYLNIILNFVNFAIIFLVTRRLWNPPAALFALLVYTASGYLIHLNMTPWNVTLMPGIAALIFYALVQVYEGNERWLFVAWALSGLYFHIHFTAIFLPFIIIASLVFAPNKLKAIRYSLFSLPLFFIWLLPNVIYELQQTGGDRFQYQQFLNDYYIGFHLRFMLHRLHDAFLQFQTILAYNVPFLSALKFVIPLLFGVVVTFFENDRRMKKIGYLLSLWFIVPLIGFTLYGGPLSDYYFLFQVYPVLVILIYLQQKLLKRHFTVGLTLLVLLWIAFTIHNTKDYWIKPKTGGLSMQKAYVRQVIAEGHTIEYQEGSIEAYLYGIWTDKKRKTL